MGSFGFGAAGRSRLLAHFSPPAPDAFISPSEDWTGTAASGFSSTPTDPTRTTAKPAMRLLVPPNQFYTDDLLVGVVAGANNEGSLYDNMGLSHVTTHYEGNSVDIASPSFETFNDANGNPVTYFGWWIRLKHDGRLGVANLYFEAVPTDATMQNRVIGPFRFCPNDTLHDWDKTIPGDYATVKDAATASKAANARNPRVTITQAGLYQTEDQFTNAWTIDGRFTIEASVPGVVFGFESYTRDRQMQVPRYPMCLRGANITLDTANFTEWYVGSIADIHPWLDGTRITNSDGRDSLKRGGPINPAVRIVRGRPFFTECTFDETANSAYEAGAVRGCTFDNVGQDIFTDSWLVVGNRVTNHNDEFWNTDIDAFSVEYTGAEATATLSRSGGTEGNTGGVWTASYGANSATFDTGQGTQADLDARDVSAGRGYWFADVVEWLNGLPGWSAKLLISPDRRAASGSLAGEKGQGFADLDVKDTPATIVSLFDKHGDFYQQALGNSSFSTRENVIIMGNTGVTMQVQSLFLAPADGGHTRDYLVVNNAFWLDPAAGDYFDADVLLSQFGRGRTAHTLSHVVVAHNSWANQKAALRTDASGANKPDFDGYCLNACNTAPDLTWAGALDADLEIASNHLHTGATGTGDAGETKAGTAADLFADAAAGDFAPAGELLANLKAPVVRYDLNGNERGATAAAGAVR